MPAKRYYVDDSCPDCGGSGEFRRKLLSSRCEWLPKPSYANSPLDLIAMLFDRVFKKETKRCTRCGGRGQINVTDQISAQMRRDRGEERRLTAEEKNRKEKEKQEKEKRQREMAEEHEKWKKELYEEDEWGYSCSNPGCSNRVDFPNSLCDECF